MKESKYEDKFTMPIYKAYDRNKELLQDALDALYSTFIEDEWPAQYRGKAIQSINNICRFFNYNDIVRHD